MASLVVLRAAVRGIAWSLSRSPYAPNPVLLPSTKLASSFRISTSSAMSCSLLSMASSMPRSGLCILDPVISPCGGM